MREPNCTCQQCGRAFFKQPGAINRAVNSGYRLFCGRVCSGLARRKADKLSGEAWRVHKAEYDRQRRAELGAALLAEKRAAYYAKLATDAETVRAKQRAYREANMARHVEYCRRPEYRQKKAAYDQTRRDNINYGPFAESAALLRDVEAEVLSRASRYDLDLASGKLNKSTRRKREYAKAVGC